MNFPNYNYNKSKTSFKKFLSFSLLPLSILSLTSLLYKTPQHPKSNLFSQQSPTTTISENKIQNLNHNNIDINVIDWLWKSPYQEVKPYTDDHSLSQIRSGWTLKGSYFSFIEVKFEKESEYKTLYFDINNDDSRTNTEEFTKWLISYGTITYKTIFGKEYMRIDLPNINFDSTFRFQTDNPNEKFNNITPIMFGKGFGHDPRYVGRLQFDSTYNPTTIKFLDVLKQKEEPGTSYDLQKRSAFSQNPNQEYILTNSLKNISDYPENFPFQGPGNGTFNNAREWINKFQSSVIDGDFQVDIALIKGKWYAELYWNNSFNDKIPPQRWDISDGGDFPKHENLDNIEKITFTRNTSFFPYRGWVHTLNFEKTSFNTFKNLSWFFEKYGYQTNDTSYIIFLPKVATVSIIHSNFFSRTVLEKVDIYY